MLNLKLSELLYDGDNSKILTSVDDFLIKRIRAGVRYLQGYTNEHVDILSIADVINNIDTDITSDIDIIETYVRDQLNANESDIIYAYWCTRDINLYLSDKKNNNINFREVEIKPGVDFVLFSHDDNGDTLICSKEQLSISISNSKTIQMAYTLNDGWKNINKQQ